MKSLKKIKLSIIIDEQFSSVDNIVKSLERVLYDQLDLVKWVDFDIKVETPKPDGNGMIRLWD
jgi:hypothetical protein